MWAFSPQTEVPSAIPLFQSTYTASDPLTEQKILLVRHLQVVYELLRTFKSLDTSVILGLRCAMSRSYTHAYAISCLCVGNCCTYLRSSSLLAWRVALKANCLELGLAS